MRRRLLILCLSVLIGALGICISGSAHASSLQALDQKLVQALKEPPGQRALDLFGDADQMLNAIHKQRQPQKGGATDLDVTVRASLIDSMRDVVALDMQKATLESVRAQVKALDLVRSLWEAAGVNQAEKTPELDHLVNAHYDRLAKTGAQDRNAAVTYGIPEGQKLLFRIFVQRDGGQLSAFELSGDKAQRKATWRENPLPARAGALLAKVGAIIGAPTTTKNLAFPAGAYPFVLLVAGKLSEADTEPEAKLAKPFESLPEHGIVPFMIEGAGRRQPFTMVPSVAASPEARAALRGGDTILYHRASEAELWRWDAVASLRDLDKAIALALDIAGEAAGDLGRTAPPAAATRPQLSALVDKPIEVAKETAARLLTALVSEAALTDGGRMIALKPDVPLKLRAELPRSEWGQYGFGASEAPTLVWLRKSELRAYVPPKKDAADDQATEPLKGESKGKPKGDVPKKGIIDSAADAARSLLGTNKPKPPQ